MEEWLETLNDGNTITVRTNERTYQANNVSVPSSLVDELVTDFDHFLAFGGCWASPNPVEDEDLVRLTGRIAKIRGLLRAALGFPEGLYAAHLSPADWEGE